MMVVVVVVVGDWSTLATTCSCPRPQLHLKHLCWSHWQRRVQSGGHPSHHQPHYHHQYCRDHGGKLQPSRACRRRLEVTTGASSQQDTCHRTPRRSGWHHRRSVSRRKVAFWGMPCRPRTVSTPTRGTPFECCPKSPLPVRASLRFPGWKAEGDLAYREKEKKKPGLACGDRLVVAGGTIQETCEVSNTVQVPP
jgi:hypothetical protein